MFWQKDDYPKFTSKSILNGKEPNYPIDDEFLNESVKYACETDKLDKFLEGKKISRGLFWRTIIVFSIFFLMIVGIVILLAWNWHLLNCFSGCDWTFKGVDRIEIRGEIK